MNYQRQAEQIAKQLKLTMTAEFVKHGLYFPDDNEPRDIYEITLSKDGRDYTFNFGQSIACSGKNPEYSVPTLYDVLACLTKYDPGTFEDFCSEFGYNTDSVTARKTYDSVREEWLNMERLFSAKDIELLQEIW